MVNWDWVNLLQKEAGVLGVIFRVSPWSVEWEGIQGRHWDGYKRCRAPAFEEMDEVIRQRLALLVTFGAEQIDPI